MKLKQWQNIFHVIVNANSIVQYVIQIKNGIIKHVNVNVNIIVCTKKIIVGIPAHVFVRIVSIIDTSVTKCDKIINATSNASIDCHIIKVRDCYIFHTVLLAIILLLEIIIICYHYAKQRGIK